MPMRHYVVCLQTQQLQLCCHSLSEGEPHNTYCDGYVCSAVCHSSYKARPHKTCSDQLRVFCSGQPQFAERPRGPKLLDSIMAALRRDGSILMPVDTAGRVLEIMLLLEKHWAVNRLSYPLALLSPVAYNTLEFAKSQLEWMNEQVAKEFENSRDKDNPFSMR